MVPVVATDELPLTLVNPTSADELEGVNGLSFK
jgi:hypothetical protein